MESSYSKKPLFIDININKCVLCEACVLICHNRALKFKRYKNGIEIIVRKDLCDEKCTKCVDICLFKAINKKCNSIVSKYFIEYKKCDNCGEFIVKNDKKLCSKCKQKISAQRIFEYIKF